MMFDTDSAGSSDSDSRGNWSQRRYVHDSSLQLPPDPLLTIEPNGQSATVQNPPQGGEGVVPRENPEGIQPLVDSVVVLPPVATANVPMPPHHVIPAQPGVHHNQGEPRSRRVRRDETVKFSISKEHGKKFKKALCDGLNAETLKELGGGGVTHLPSTTVSALNAW